MLKFRFLREHFRIFEEEKDTDSYIFFRLCCMSRLRLSAENGDGIRESLQRKEDCASGSD